MQEDTYSKNAQQPNLSVLIVEDNIGPWWLHAASEKKLLKTRARNTGREANLGRETRKLCSSNESGCYLCQLRCPSNHRGDETYHYHNNVSSGICSIYGGTRTRVIQKNIDKIYKLNGLPPVRFPPPKMIETVTKVCRELFQQQVREPEEKCSHEQMSTATERDRMSDNAFAEEDISDKVIANQAMEIDRMIKRHRNSLTPPNLHEQKRKKEEEESTKAHSEVRPPVPPKQPTTTAP